MTEPLLVSTSGFGASARAGAGVGGATAGLLAAGFPGCGFSACVGPCGCTTGGLCVGGVGTGGVGTGGALCGGAGALVVCATATGDATTNPHNSRRSSDADNEMVIPHACQAATRRVKRRGGRWQRNRLNSPLLPTTGEPCAARSPGRFSHGGGRREDDGGPWSNDLKRFARSAICTLLRGPPSSSVLTPC